MERKQVVVTGMGAVSPLGGGVSPFWRELLAGNCGIRNITRFNTSDFKFCRAGEVRDLVFPSGLDGDERSAGDLATRYLLVAAHEALLSAGLLGATPEILARTGVALGTNFGGMLSGEAVFEQMAGGGETGGGGFSEFNFQAAADRVAGKWGLGGPRVVLSLSCSSGTAAIGYGMDLIRSGRADIVLAAGYDALSRFAWSGLSALRTMSSEAVRPFDKNRDGTIFSEGAGVLVLESLSSARQRGTEILAVAAGYGLNNNAWHMTAPARAGAGSADVMQKALADAGLQAGDVDHINAHGTGTVPNDVTETMAIKAVFGAHAMAIPVTSIKGTVGHLMGAAGSLEAIASILSLRDGVVPPTINYETPDPECDLDYVVNEKRNVQLRSVISNSAGIGGCNAAVVFRL